jgi:hypothetical protein
MGDTGRPKGGQNKLTGHRVWQLVARVRQMVARVRQNGLPFAGLCVSRPLRGPADDQVLDLFGADLATTVKNSYPCLHPTSSSPLTPARHFFWQLRICFETFPYYSSLKARKTFPTRCSHFGSSWLSTLFGSSLVQVLMHLAIRTEHKLTKTITSM